MVMSADPWKQVANQAALGDRVAARRLIDGVTPALLRLVRTILGPGRRVDVEDVTQESRQSPNCANSRVSGARAAGAGFSRRSATARACRT